MYFSRLRAWCVQRVANLGLVAVVLLMVIAFWYDRPSHDNEEDREPTRPGGGKKYHRHHRSEMTTSQLVFVYYTLFVHVLGLLFPMRLVWATRSMISNLRKAVSQPLYQARTAPSQLGKAGESISVYEDSLSSADCSGSESEEIELSLSTSTSTEIEWEDEPLLHAIIIPNYKEELETLRETLDIFASHPQASSSYEVCSCRSTRKIALAILTRLRSLDLPCNGARRNRMRRQSSCADQ